MKVLVCRECGDLVKLRAAWRWCACQRSAGRYVDREFAQIQGPAFVVGIDNGAFERLVRSAKGSVVAQVTTERVMAHGQ